MSPDLTSILAHIPTLRRLAVDAQVAIHVTQEHLLPRRIRLVDDRADIAQVVDPTPVADPERLAALIQAASAAQPGVNSTDPASALVRAHLLLDACQGQAALASLAPALIADDPDALRLAAWIAADLGDLAAGLAALNRAGPGSATFASRAVLLARVSPDAALRAADTALEMNPSSLSAHWARCAALLQAGQPAASEVALVGLQEVAPDARETAAMVAAVATAIGRHGHAASVYRGVLAADPSDVGALVGLANSERHRQWLSLRWTATMAAAARAAPGGSHGGWLLQHVAAHRRGVARTVGYVSGVGLSFVGTSMEWFTGRPFGLAVLTGVLACLATAAVVWAATPRTVRAAVRRADASSGPRRAPDWRRAVLSLVVALLTLLIDVQFGVET